MEQRGNTWIYPEDKGEFPPSGKPILVLTEGGATIISSWNNGNNGGFIAWAELPKGKRPSTCENKS